MPLHKKSADLPSKPPSQPTALWGKVEQVHDGVPERYHRRKDGSTVIYTVCCDCGLVHKEEYVPHTTYLRVRAWRDEARTRRMRAIRRARRNRNGRR